jgi:hypothetical protein
MIATAGTVPDLLHQTPMYFLNALRSRLQFITDVIEREYERRAADTTEVRPLRDVDLTPQLEVRSRLVRDSAQARALAWLAGKNPDDPAHSNAEAA